MSQKDNSKHSCRIIMAALLVLLSIALLHKSFFAAAFTICYAYLISPLSIQLVSKICKKENEKWLYSTMTFIFALCWMTTIQTGQPQMDNVLTQNSEKNASLENASTQNNEKIASLEKELQSVKNERDEIQANNQKRAISAAKSYLEYSPMSSRELIKQLELEEFSHEDAAYGVEHADINWNDQASRSAVLFIEFANPSTEELKKQLEYEGFTSNEIKFAIEHNSNG